MSLIELAYQNTTATVSTSGGQIVSFHPGTGVAAGREIIWQADPQVWDQHAPLLFPICGSAKHGMIEVNGRTYTIPKHGITRANPPMQIAAQGKDYVDLELSDNEETRKVYPFSFSFHVVYALYANGFRTQFVIKNTGEEPMPFCVGGHPAFNCPLEDGAQFSDYDLIFPQTEDGRVEQVTKDGMLDGSEILPFFQGNRMPLNHEEIDCRDSLLFTTLSSRSVRLENRNTGKGLCVSFPKMEALAVWSPTGRNADFICLEPWHGTPAYATESGKLEDKAFVTVLSAGETYSTWFDVTLD